MRLALGVEYDGGGFSGWQRLSPAGSRDPDGSLQTALEIALSKVADARVDTTCAGRTDAGVHGQCQVVHFDTDAERDARGWILGATANLPPTMAVRWCVPVADDFNARFSARARRYRYRILNRSARPGLERQYLGWERMPLDADAIASIAASREDCAASTAFCAAFFAARFSAKGMAFRASCALAAAAVSASACFAVDSARSVSVSNGACMLPS